MKMLEQLYIQIRTDKFYLLKFLLEAYDGLGILSSSGIRKDLVLLRYPVEMRRDMFSFLAAVAPELNPYRSASGSTSGSTS